MILTIKRKETEERNVSFLAAQVRKQGKWNKRPVWMKKVLQSLKQEIHGMEASRLLRMKIENSQSGNEMSNVEFNLANHVKDNTKGFFKHSNNKRRTKDYVGP